MSWEDGWVHPRFDGVLESYNGSLHSTQCSIEIMVNSGGFRKSQPEVGKVAL